MNLSDSISHPLPGLSNATIRLFSDKAGTLFIISEAEAKAWGEAEIQMVEGCTYEYDLPGYILDNSFGVIQKSQINPSQGRFVTKNYVGTLCIPIFNEEGGEACGNLTIEVKSIKLNYREHYRKMLSDIAEYCNELLLQANSPLIQKIEPLFSGDAKTLYQRFVFLKSVIATDDFSQSIQKIVSSPATTWETQNHEKDSRGIKRYGKNQIRQIASASNRYPIPAIHPLYQSLSSIPQKLDSTIKRTTVDNPENQFVKHALNTFLCICTDVINKSDTNFRLQREAKQLALELEQHLNNQIFKEVYPLRSIPISSPVLQRKEGYREVLRIWLMHDLASRISWEGGDDVYSGGKKDVATLYEYWVFFRLLEMIKDVFKVKSEDIDQLLSSSQNGLNLSLKRGKHLAIKGLYQTATRTLNIEFSYNRQFSGQNEYPKAGSWTKSFRPDYTLSVWPFGIDQHLAENEETIVHIHFDAKYRVKDLLEIIGNEDDTVTASVSGNDLLKMHAYRDAIRRTAGAYVLYPGDEIYRKSGFHEVIPGLGAFTLKPGSTDQDEASIKDFIRAVAKHLLDRATQREKIALKTFEVYRDKQTHSVYAPMPVLTGENRDIIPDETYVLIAWYKDFYHKNWIEQNGIFNVRTGLKRGSIALTPKLTGTKYILLHSKDELQCGNIYRVNGEGPKIWSNEDLIERKYPHTPSAAFYLVFSLQDKKVSVDFDSAMWDISKLGNYTAYRGSALPFVVSLTDLMKVKVSKDSSNAAR